MEKCFYCDGSEALLDVMKEVMRLPECTLYMHRDQTHPGRAILAANKHVRKVTELKKEEYMRLMGDVHDVSKALTALYKPDKLNLLLLGDKSSHMHIHLVPKYKDGKDWGKVFLTDEPDPVFIEEKVFDEQIDRLRQLVKKIREQQE